MKVSTKGQYATRALLDLALHQDEEPVLLKYIAQRQRISLSYLEHIITPLLAAGIISSTRGPKGGISLVRAPEDIRLDEVIQLLEGAISPVECVGNPNVCMRSQSCATREVWDELRQAMTGVLRSVTLRDLMERQREKENTAEIMYYI
ncbi:MAG: Rrf2 family transcriptional regulator [Dehalococcoidales bacterium]|nr:MAG: Rrf2 family transcriptional regulator [Dehalococcoidales bacterium]